MKFAKQTLLAFSLGAASVSAMAVPAIPGAAPITITFEGVNSFGSIGDYYNGGTDDAGNSGTNYGVSFTPSALGLANDGVDTYFANAPSALNVMFASDDVAYMNFSTGFVGLASIHYSSTTSAPNAIQIFSGLNGTGSVLGAFSLNLNTPAGCTGAPYCNFEKTTVVFSGVGQSIGFGGNTGNVAFDDVTITPVPEASTYAMLALGLGAIGLYARRRTV